MKCPSPTNGPGRFFSLVEIWIEADMEAGRLKCLTILKKGIRYIERMIRGGRTMGKEPQDIRREEKMRISKMMSEGGQGIQAYYFNNYVDEPDVLDEERIAAKAMIDEGGLGAEIYYNSDEKIANIDIENNDDYVS